jgi:hypothetical protein
LYVIALNFSDKPVERRRIEIHGGGAAAGRARVAGESREVEVVGGAITDDFGAYEVKIYDIPVTK